MTTYEYVDIENNSKFRILSTYVTAINF